jgi:hypothetical protein
VDRLKVAPLTEKGIPDFFPLYLTSGILYYRSIK